MDARDRLELETRDDVSSTSGSATSHPQRKRIPIKLKGSKAMTRGTKDDELARNLQFTTAKISSSSEPLHDNRRLRWNHRVELIGSKIQDPLIHTCNTCTKPILLYGRLLPCKHVFCFSCANKNSEKCPRCDQSVTRVEAAALGSVFLCTYGGSKHGVSGCHRTYLSHRDLQAHMQHRHYNKEQRAATQHEAAVSESLMTSQALQPPISGPRLSHPSLPGPIQFNPLQPPPQLQDSNRMFAPSQPEGAATGQMMSIRSSQPQVVQPVSGQLLHHQPIVSGVPPNTRLPFNQPVAVGQIRHHNQPVLIPSAGASRESDSAFQNISVMSSRTNLITVPIQEERQMFDMSQPPPPFSSQSAPPLHFPEGSFPNQHNLPPSSFSGPQAGQPPFNAQIQFDPRATMRQSAPPNVMVSMGQPTSIPPRNPSVMGPGGVVMPLSNVVTRPPTSGLLSPPGNSSGMVQMRPGGMMHPGGNVSEGGEGTYRSSSMEVYLSSGQAPGNHDSSSTSNIPPGVRTAHPPPTGQMLRQALPPRGMQMSHEMHPGGQQLRHSFPDPGMVQPAVSGSSWQGARPRTLLMRPPVGNSNNSMAPPRQMQFYQQMEPQ